MNYVSQHREQPRRRFRNRSIHAVQPKCLSGSSHLAFDSSDLISIQRLVAVPYLRYVRSGMPCASMIYKRLRVPVPSIGPQVIWATKYLVKTVRATKLRGLLTAIGKADAASCTKCTALVPVIDGKRPGKLSRWILGNSLTAEYTIPWGGADARYIVRRQRDRIGLRPAELHQERIEGKCRLSTRQAGNQDNRTTKPTDSGLQSAATGQAIENPLYSTTISAKESTKRFF